LKRELFIITTSATAQHACLRLFGARVETSAAQHAHLPHSRTVRPSVRPSVRPVRFSAVYSNVVTTSISFPVCVLLSELLLSSICGHT